MPGNRSRTPLPPATCGPPRRLKTARCDQIETFRRPGVAAHHDRPPFLLRYRVHAHVKSLCQNHRVLDFEVAAAIFLLRTPHHERARPDPHELHADAIRYGLRRVLGLGLDGKAACQESTRAEAEEACHARSSEVRDQGSGVRGQKSEVRSQKSGVRDQESGIRNQGLWSL